jgi:general secretion pathway protein L
MSVLVIQLPPRDRLRARSAAADTAAAWRLPQEWSFVLSSDGRTVAQAGQAPLSLLPRADSVVLVLAEADVAWHRVLVPRAPMARLRAALAGVMEESLLDDDEALHLALGPGAAAGREGWVAATHRPWLQAALAALEGAGRTVEKVLPASAPTAAAADPARGHFFVAGASDEAVPWLTLARADGVVCLRLAGGLARALLPAAGEAVQWTATPAAAAAAEQWLGAPVPLMSDAERALEAARGAANLRQFELASRHRGSRVIRAGARRFLSREWRPVRVGLGLLAAVHLLGLNAYAWQQRAALADKRQAMSELLRATHPGVRTVLDAPLQMQRETERLRAAAGRAGDNDLEVLLAVAASAWPDGQGPVQTLRFETGQLTLAAPAWAAQQQAQFRERLRSAGFAAEFSEGRLTVTRAAA